MLFPTLDLDLVKQVIAFYHANTAELDHYLEATRAQLDRQEAVGLRVDRDKLRKRFAEVYPEPAKKLLGE
ncbi:MAG: hypothetical protein ACJ8F7_15380 [Gemmataceae bacterium]